MIRALVFACLVALGVDGSPWESVTAEVPAARVATTVQVTPTTEAPRWPVMPGPCSEWAGLAFEVGWPSEEWRTLSDVMFCESRCNPGAHNRSGATGLLQVMPMHARDGEDLYDPQTNLAVGLRVRRSQGWRAWSCYR